MKPAGVSHMQWVAYNLLFFFQHWIGYERYVRWFSGSRKKLAGNIQTTPGTVKSPIEASAGQLADPSLARGRHPILFRQAAASWTAVEKWDFDFFTAGYGDRVIELNSSSGLSDPRSPQEFEQLSLQDYIEQVKAGTLKYLKLSALVQKEPGLQQDLDRPWLEKFKRGTSFGEVFYTFMGGKGTITPLHNEFPCNVYVQVSGQKRWVLYDVSERIYLDAITERRPYFFSKASPDKDNPDLPLQRFANRYEVILNPGDVLWVPPFVWHYVENITDSIGVAYKFADIPASWHSSKMLTALFFLSTRPSILYSFFASRISKEDYVLSKKHVKPATTEAKTA